MVKNVDAGRLNFTQNWGNALDRADEAFIAVGIPTRRGEGHAEPPSIYANTGGAGEVSEEAVREVMTPTPPGIQMCLGLNRPIYQRTAAYGNFGQEPDMNGGFS